MATKVMICDDSAIVRQQVAWALVSAGFEVTEAFDGQDAAEKIETMAGVGLLICDVNMPRMDGMALLSKLSEKGGKPPFPVLMLTTDGQPELIARAKSLGAKGWMVKPVNPSILVATAQKLTTP
jgi:two-component system chemotaxis response regulator CheY